MTDTYSGEIEDGLSNFFISPQGSEEKKRQSCKWREKVCEKWEDRL